METARPDTQRHGQTGPARGGSHAVRLPDGDGDSDGDGGDDGGGRLHSLLRRVVPSSADVPWGAAGGGGRRGEEC